MLCFSSCLHPQIFTPPKKTRYFLNKDNLYDIILTALLLASKVHDDTSCYNKDFSYIYLLLKRISLDDKTICLERSFHKKMKLYTLQTLNELEASFLKRTDWDVSYKSKGNLRVEEALKLYFSSEEEKLILPPKEEQ